MAMQKSMNKIQRYTISHLVNDVRNIQNRSFIKIINDLSINPPILIYRKRNTG